jgi:regulator of replication initiation timing
LGDFQDQIQLLLGEDSPLLKLDERNQASRSYYQKWHQMVAENMNGVLDYRRIVNEVNELENNIGELEHILSEKTSELVKAKEEKLNLQTEADELRELLEASKRCADAAGRVAEKRMQVSQKQLDLSLSNADVGGRDLKTVEEEHSDRLEKKDQYSNMVSDDQISIYFSLSKRTLTPTDAFHYRSIV